MVTQRHVILEDSDGRKIMGEDGQSILTTEKLIWSSLSAPRGYYVNLANVSSATPVVSLFCSFLNTLKNQGIIVKSKSLRVSFKSGGDVRLNFEKHGREAFLTQFTQLLTNKPWVLNVCFCD